MVYKLPKEAIGDNELDAGVLDSNLVNSFVPIGGIIMWSGSVADAEALTNWAICDGQNGTPDLRDKFVLGVGSSVAGSTANVNDGNTSSNSMTLSEGQMPSHNHDLNDPNHTHGVTDNGHFHYEFRSGNAGANQNQGSSNASTTNFPGSGTGPSGKYEGYNIWCVGSEPNVGRSQTTTTGLSVNSNSTGISIQAKGSGDSIDLRSKYLALCYIIRIT
tara:strand:+ start:524 stop:1174 length:651 start_codon:yes stop_codon:yes gene_type:complete